MHLLHTVFGEKNKILSILKSGYLLSSSDSKKPSSGKELKYVFMRLEKKGDYGNFVLDNQLLLKNNFFFTHWLESRGYKQ